VASRAAQGGAVPRTHAVGTLLARLEAPAAVVDAGTALAEAYTATRYPDAGPGPAFRWLGQAEAERLLDDGEVIHQWAQCRLR